MLKSAPVIAASGFAFLAIMLFSCKKEAGDGGNSSISGKVEKDVRLLLENPNTYQGSFPAADQDVYIIYGDHVSPDDRVQTNYNGQFEFLYLRPGKYKIYTFSRDTNSVDVAWDEDHMTIIREVELDEKMQQKDIGTFKVYDTE